MSSVLELHLNAVGLVYSGHHLSTSRTYTSAQKSYVTFRETHNLQALPADELEILLYIAYLSLRVWGSSFNVYLAAIRHLHVLYGYNYESLSSPRVKLAIKGINDICPPPSQKLLITLDMLVSLARVHPLTLIQLWSGMLCF